MRIRRAILHFLNEKVFGHDRGDEPNKFTNLIYAILMPIHYIVQHNTKMQYDPMRDIYIIEKMEFTGVLLRTIHKQNERFIGHNFDHFNLASGRPYGKQYSAFLRCVTAIEAGHETAFLGLKWILISLDYYKKLTNYSEYDFEVDELHFLNNQKREETMKSNIGIAAVCHEADRQYCIDNKLPTKALWDELPVTQQNSIIHGVRQVVADRKMTATKMHETWMEYKASEGWKYADELDAAKKLHPNMVAFNKLPKVERAKDMLFIRTVKAELKK